MTSVILVPCAFDKKKIQLFERIIEYGADCLQSAFEPGLEKWFRKKTRFSGFLKPQKSKFYV